MSMGYRSNSGRDVEAGLGMLWPLMAVIGVLAALVLALPALALGVVLQRLLAGRAWSFPLWLVLAFLGAGLACFFYTHGLERLIIIQLSDVALAIIRHHADIARWDSARLWSETWPVWLRTLVAAPLVAFWQELQAHTHGDSAQLLQQRERARQQRVARSKRKAARRARRPGRIPDAVNGHLVVGVLIDDECTE